MLRFNYRGELLTVNELSEMSGIAPATIRDRLRRGYPIEEAVKIVATQESIKAFSEASYWHDWIGMSASDLYKIYWKWCIGNGYTASTQTAFGRQIMQMYPNLKTVPTTVGDKSYRIIRER